MSNVPSVAAQAVLVKSETMPDDAPTVRGWDFSDGADLDGIMAAMLTSGFQATALGQAVNEVNRMIQWRLSDEAVTKTTEQEWRDPAVRAATRCKIFLSFTSNLISAGTREQFKYLAQNKMVDVIVTTAGGVEEDLIKCLGKTYLGDFSLKGADLRKRGLNRIGNLVPNDNYCHFEDWIVPILDEMLAEQQRDGVNWTPSKVIRRLGLEIKDESSLYHWAAKHDIPVYCPGLTDGSIGDMIYFHSYKNPGLKIDLVEDIRLMNDHAIKCPPPRKTGIIILGGGLPKHHVCNANLMRNGADFAVYINTAQEYDGSDSGAKPDEAVSWGKIRLDAKPVKVHADASIVFPLLVSQTFAKNWQRRE
eukprot:CAMPEP_0177781838 /NCGR_PEP_ID=MMETSP0491_2-20121128/18097_1 /TAXON_ID=63592 /ORGANISM="Tetraselmis chuii, Strain PLY429" /LENGTH=361 /DNA_ID=CAMNT_0019301997 /DNA_START=1 /DNA_END=1086 /DNA_ORIENTATION=+